MFDRTEGLLIETGWEHFTLTMPDILWQTWPAVPARLALSCTLAFLCSFVTVSSALLAYLLLSLVYVEASFHLKDSGKSFRSRAAIVQHVQTFSDVVHVRSSCAVVKFVKR